jgi:putative transposase
MSESNQTQPEADSTSPVPRPTRQPYSTDMTDEEWVQYQAFFPEHLGYPGLSIPNHSVRELLNAMRYRKRTGCQWRNLPNDFPPWKKVSSYFFKWRKEGRFEAFRKDATAKAREAEGRNAEPTAGLMDTQSVKTTSVGGPKGFDAGKKVKGRKRAIVVDVLGLLLTVMVVAASVTEGDCGAMMLRKTHQDYPTVKVAFADSAFGTKVVKAASEETGIAVEITSKPEGQKGFVPLKHRWKVERTFGWFGFFRVLSKDYDRTTTSAQAWIDLTMGDVALTRYLGRKAS